MNKKQTEIGLFYLSYLLLLFVSFFSRVNFISNFCNYIRYFALILVCMSFILQNIQISTKSIFKIIFSIIIFSISTIYSKNITLLTTLLVILASKNIDIDKFIKFVFKWSLIYLTIVVILHFLGLTDDYIDIRTDGTYRSSMGFAHPNTFGYIIMIIVMEYMYIIKDRVKFINVLFTIPVILLINYFCNSRSAIVILILLIIMLVYINIIKTKFINKKITKLIISNSFLIFTILNIILLILYRKGDEIGVLVNNIMSRRIYWIDYFIQNYGITLLGQKIEIISIKKASVSNLQYSALDNMYFYVIINYGVVILMMIIYAFKKLFKKLYENKEVVFILILFLMNVYSIMENNTLNISLNCFLIAFGKIFYNNKEPKSE